MRTLDEKTIEEIKRSYPYNWSEAMLRPNKVAEVLEFIERNKKEIEVSYTQVFFAPNGFDIYELNGERRVFCAPSEAFGVSPLSEKDSVGDWQAWLKSASKIKEIR